MSEASQVREYKAMVKSVENLRAQLRHIGASIGATVTLLQKIPS